MTNNEYIASLLIEAAELLSGEEVLTESLSDYKISWGKVPDEDLKKIKSIVNKNYKKIVNKDLKELEYNWNMEHKIVKKYIDNPDNVHVGVYDKYYSVTVWTNNNANIEFFGGHSLNVIIKIDKNNFSIIDSYIALEG